MSSRILLAGATGSVGRALLPKLREAGHWVRTVSRRPERARELRRLSHDVVLADATRLAELTGVAEGVDVVVSCLGGSVAFDLSERRSYWDVDRVANSNLLALAKKARVPRFVYVSVFVEEAYSTTRYVRAHEAFVRELRESGISATVVRPTGIFSAFDETLRMAKRGRGAIVGDGTARTNPVDPRDVADVCMEHLAEGPANVEVGGPEVLSRRAIAETAFAVVGTRPKLTEIPPWVLRATSIVARPFHPRISDLMDFVARVSTTDAVAPSRGRRTLHDHHAERFSGFSPESNASNGSSRASSSFRITA